MPLRGNMVSGFVAPDFDKACYPPMFAQTLRSLGYRMDLDGRGGLASPEQVENCILDVFEARKSAIRHIIKNEYWDLCIAVITETDRLQHFFLHALDDPAHPKYDWTKRFFIELDQFIGEVAEMLDGKADLFMVSDHGFNVVKKEIIIQKILQDLDLPPESIQPCWMEAETAKKTKVFTLDPGRIYINSANGRFKHGFVKEDEAEDILSNLEKVFSELKDPETGQTMVSAIRRKEEGFSGGELGYAPDLVVATHPGYYFKSFKYGEKSEVIEVKWEANHVWNDAIVYTPYNIPENYQPMIWDVLPSALAKMGLDLPEDIDGRDLFMLNT